MMTEIQLMLLHPFLLNFRSWAIRVLRFFTAVLFFVLLPAAIQAVTIIPTYIDGAGQTWTDDSEGRHSTSDQRLADGAARYPYDQCHVRFYACGNWQLLGPVVWHRIKACPMARTFTLGRPA